MSNKGAKITAFIALAAIILSIVGTGIMFIMGDEKQKKEINLGDEELKKIIKDFENSSGATMSGKTQSGIEEEKVLTGKIEK